MLLFTMPLRATIRKLRGAHGAVVAKDADAVLALMNRLRRLSALASATGWMHQKHAQYEATEVELKSSLHERRRSAIAAWKIRMREFLRLPMG